VTISRPKKKGGGFPAPTLGGESIYSARQARKVGLISLGSDRCVGFTDFLDEPNEFDGTHGRDE